MSGLSFRCIGCKGQKVATDEYHWHLDTGQEIVWRLCEDCCAFAVDVVELIANLETEVEAWKS